MDLLSTFMVAVFVLSASLPLQATALGLQCPTAPIQKVLVPVRDCCGKTVAFQVRKPHQGEKAFVQCRCAEKRSVAQKATAPAKETTLLCDSFELAPHTSVTQHTLVPETCAVAVDRTEAPTVPPPVLA